MNPQYCVRILTGNNLLQLPGNVYYTEDYAHALNEAQKYTTANRTKTAIFRSIDLVALKESPVEVTKIS